jgi:hypothetical protein
MDLNTLQVESAVVKPTIAEKLGLKYSARISIKQTQDENRSAWLEIELFDQTPEQRVGLEDELHRKGWHFAAKVGKTLIFT